MIKYWAKSTKFPLPNSESTRIRFNNPEKCMLVQPTITHYTNTVILLWEGPIYINWMEENILDEVVLLKENYHLLIVINVISQWLLKYIANFI